MPENESGVSRSPQKYCRSGVEFAAIVSHLDSISPITSQPDAAPSAVLSVPRFSGIRALYLCYFGVREPLVNTQVVPYLAAMAECGAEMMLLTFEPDLEKFAASEQDAIRSLLRLQGIEWYRLPYHKRPTLPATLYDVCAGAFTTLRLVRRRKINLLHARSHVPALMAALVTFFTGTKFIFDIRGLMADEYVDAGHWPANGVLYRGTKAVERKLLRSANGFVVLTQVARELLFPKSKSKGGKDAPVEVIPCCVDGRRFKQEEGQRERGRNERGWANRRVLLYLGALNGWYLSEEMAQFFAAAFQQDHANLPVVITQSDGAGMAKRLIELGLQPGNFLIRSASPQEVPGLLAAADVAISFIKPSFSKKASSPTKIGEYLASGVPVLCNSGIGDTDQVITGERVGVMLHEFNLQAYGSAMQQMLELLRDPGIHERCREVAFRHFDLQRVGAERYARLYAAVAGISTPAAGERA